MSWSYSGDPSNSDLDFVRFTITDTNSQVPLMQDGEINFLIEKYGVKQAILKCFDIVCTKFAQEADYSLGPENVKASQRFENYKAMVDKYIKEHVLSNGYPINNQPSEGHFKMGMFDNGPEISQ